MKTLKISLLSVACAIALGACSSVKDSVNSYINSQANQAQKSANQKAQDAKEAQKNAEEKAREAENKLAESEKKLAEANSSETNTKEELKKAEAEKDNAAKAAQAEKERADKLQQELDAAKKAEQDKLVALAAEERRVAENVAALQAGFEDRGTENKIIAYGFRQTPTEFKISNVAGKILTVENGTLADSTFPTAHKDLNTLLIDGKSIQLFDSADIQASYSMGKTTVKEIDGDDYLGHVVGLSKSKYHDDHTQSRYGYVTKNGKTTLFVQGHLTPIQNAEEPKIASPYDHGNHFNRDGAAILDALPTDKVYAYQGLAFYGKENNYVQLNTEAIADFNEKKVKVELKEADTVKLTLGGNIKEGGNTFAGQYNGVHTNGAFYGKAGLDIAGTFYVAEGADKDYNGVFGATKQGCGILSCSEAPAGTSLADFQVK
ncbi:transferrin-binding protein-like solute binding protein [Bibersteinia trehalosi]|uniref:transferrin-binding protein-like solute binding protein n=1 Tax=Bibersteinia trehalosi TaxID=47735 RepID=UPI002D798A4F|nr:transferrin-binding protein-like solute binding protein [Bibersteinia trehalosi]